jgi:SAM-dependent methyltransferase
MASQDYSRYFDAYYFAHCCGRPYQRDEHWLGFFDAIAERIVQDINPSTVLDVGCAWGFLVERLRQRGVEAYGLDVSEYAIQHVHPDVQPYCWVGSAAELFQKKYDLIVCIEVLEHMPRDEAEKAVENFCSHSDEVLFSSTPFDYKEPTHINLQPPEHWGELFARQGFFRDVDFDASVITPWAVRYQRTGKPLARLVRDYERKFFLLWKENLDLRSQAVQMRDELAALEGQYSGMKLTTSDLEQRAEQARAELQAIFNSRGWRFLNFLYRIRLALVPQGSRRERLLFPRK